MVLRSEILSKMGTNLMRHDLMHRAYEGETCKLIDGVFAYLVQILLFIVAAAALVFKRYCRIVECKYYPKPKRSLFVWFLDVSKQAVGHILGHFLNLLIAIQLSKALLNSYGQRKIHADQCAWYCINFCIDNVFGIPMVWGLLVLTSWVAKRFNFAALKQSGNYGAVVDNALLAPPKKKITVLTNWSIQTSIFVMSLLLAKMVLTIIVWFLSDPLGHIGVFVFRGLAQYPHMELLFVMVLFPCVSNIFVVWIYDNMLMEGEGLCKNLWCCTHCKKRCRCRCCADNADEESALASDKTIAVHDSTALVDDSKTR